MKRALLIWFLAFVALTGQAQTAQMLPFSQNWTNIGLITANDDWSGVPGVIGYRGDGLTGATGTDPQTILIEGAPVLDVNANQTNPNTFATGGVTEFHLTDPVVALAGSGTARAPYIQIAFVTTGLSNIQVSYNLRDIDGSTDNATQPVALQYRIGTTGNFTNVPAAFVADASTGPSLATLVTPVSVTLPAAANNQAVVQIRIITSDAVGNDEWIGIDDIAISGAPACSLTSAGLANITCENLNESGDPNDDYIAFDLNPTGTGLGASYSVTSNAGTVSTTPDGPAATGIAYGSATNFLLPAGSAGAGNVLVTVTDASGAPCTFTVNVTDPGSCSAGFDCELTSTGLANITCNDNGTLSDPSDDYISFMLTPEGDNLGASFAYNVTVSSGTVTLLNGQSATNITYDGTFTFRLQNGSAGAGNVTITVTDVDNPDCTIDDVVTDPGACSIACNLEVTGLTITPPSCSTSMNAAVTIDVACSSCQGPIEYTIDGINFQLSPTFLNLAPGTYIVTVRDVSNPACTDAEPFSTGFGDVTPPVVTAGSIDACYFTVAAAEAAALAATTASDNSGVPPTLTVSTTGTCQAVVTVTATDGCGNAASVSYNTQIDSEVPVFVAATLPADALISCSAPLPPVATVTATDNCAGTVQPVIFINEIHYDNVGADVNEFVEIAGTAGINLSGYSLVLYNGSDGAPYNTLALSGVIDNEGGGFGAVHFTYPVNGVQNGAPDGVALVQGSTVLQFLSYEGTFTATGGPAAGLTSTAIPVLEDGANAVGTSIQLTGTGTQYASFTWVGPPAASSAGTLNAGQTIQPGPSVVTATVSSFTVPGSCPQSYTLFRTYTATDNCGNVAAHTQVITVVDNTAPVFSAPLPPANVTVSCADSVPPAPVVVATDNCDIPAATVWINEIHYDNAGGDVGEFIEIAGPAGLNLANYSLVLYNGANGLVDFTQALSGIIDDENGYGGGAIAFFIPGIMNGSPDGVALVQGSTVIQFLSWEGTFAAVNGPAAGLTASAIPVQEDGTNAVGTSIQLIGTGTQYSQFTWTGPANDSPGDINDGQEPGFSPAQGGPTVALVITTTPSTLCPQNSTITRTYTATDACGNTATFVQTVSIVDNVPPTVTAGTISACYPTVAAAEAAAIAATTATDNCSMQLTRTASTTGTCTAVITVTVTDQCGNSASVTYNTSILSTPATLTAGTIAACYPTAQAAQTAAIAATTVSGGCPGATLTATVVGTCSAMVTVTATNACGNTATVTYNTRIDNTPPTVTAGTIATCYATVAAAQAAAIAATTATDNCPGALTTTAATTGTCSAVITVTVTDGCGNAATVSYNTRIDNTPPTVTCQPLTVSLNIFGTVTVTSAQIQYSASDNCPGALTLQPASATFTCANEGTTAPFTITVTDACGNAGTCTSQITVLPYDRCTPEISISDPCVCLNNATTLTNGQFRETIYIESLAGKTWTVVAANGLYSDNSLQPPTAPTPIAPGTQFVEIPANSGDYYLTGRHVDALGYTITVISELGEVLTIGNSCEYPNPAITSNLTGPFCAGSDPVALTGTPGDANIASQEFTINGVPATVFDPAALGPGSYAITYTVNGGTPKAAGPNDPGCIQSVTAFAQVFLTPAAVVCNDQLQISLDQNCQATLSPDDVLEGTYSCYDDYTVEADRILPFNGNGPWTPAIFTVNDLDKTYQVRVTHVPSGSSCWGMVTIEDKTAPVATCTDLTINCAVTNYTPGYLQNTLGLANVFPAVVENCGAYTQTYLDQFVDLGCNGSVNGVTDLSGYVLRKWTVTDASANTGTCQQFIYFEAVHVADVTLPADVTVSCTNGNTDPAVTGVPFVAAFGQQFPLYPTSGLCELSATYTDQVLPICDGSYKILRRWTLYDWCLPSGPQNPLYHTQLIKVQDVTGPQIACPANLTVSTDPFNCCGTVDLPDAIISDNCSRINSISAMIEQLDQQNNPVAMFTASGTLTTFPGNNLWNPDTLGAWGLTPCLPVATHRVTYTAIDDCGNTTTCTFRLTVDDQVPPVAVCDEHTQVALGISGTALIDASVLDDGSFDNCAAVSFKARRMGGNGGGGGSCQSTSQFHDEVRFCCSDVGNTITVVLRVYDVPVPAGSVSTSFQQDNSNECMVQVLVEDKLKPACVSPANVTVSCENFDETLWAYGLPEIDDNCCLDDDYEYQNVEGLEHAVNYQNFDTVCNRGTILRTFRVYDCSGNTTSCTQRVVVNYEQDYYVRFPNDVLITFCDSTGVYGQPTFFGEDCELLSTSFEDEVFVNVPDACYKIERTWHVINWCQYNPNLPLTYVPNPNPHPNALNAQNFPGPVVAACTANTSNTPTAFLPTVVKINPTDPVATNYCQYWSANTNGYEYKQIIKIIDQQNPEIDCPASPQEYCDYTANDPLLWNDMVWYDAALNLHDLCEGPTDLTINTKDLCSGTDVNVAFQLFLDLDNDGTMETVVSSNEPSTLTPGFVRFGNAATPNFLGGQLQQYDFRAVPPSQYYRFGVQTSVVGGQKRASVRWFTQTNDPSVIPNPVQGLTPELPYGTHKIKWFVSDGCGNTAVCEYTFVVKDCKKPTVVCVNGLSVNIMPTGMIALSMGDFLLYGDDNCTPAAQLKYGIRRTGTGTGFPVDAFGNPITTVAFQCPDLGTQFVDVWAQDAAGNADFCQTYVIIQDNMDNCSPNSSASGTVAGVLATEDSVGVEDAQVQLEGTHPAAPPVSLFQMSDNDGAYLFSNALPIPSNYTVTPAKDDNPLNGVTTYDLVLIARHILGLELLDSPYKMIAADANRSNSITTFDIVELRKLILGIYYELPNNTSWRFVDAAYQFPNASNPFVPFFPETISVANLIGDNLDDNFVGMKVGDVNQSALPNNLVSTDDRSGGTLLFDVGLTPTLPPSSGHASQGEGVDRMVAAGEEFTVTFRADDAVLGYQFTLLTPGLEVLDITSTTPGLTADNFAVFTQEEAITTSFGGTTATEVAATFTLRLRATRAGKLSELLAVSNRITKAEAYTATGQKLDVALRFASPAAPAAPDPSQGGEEASPSPSQGGEIKGVGFELYQNEPNPWTNRTMIGFYLPEAGTATLTVYDESGRTLYQTTGAFAKGYNAVPLTREQVRAAGMLYYKLEANGQTATRKMVEMK